MVDTRTQKTDMTNILINLILDLSGMFLIVHIGLSLDNTVVVQCMCCS